MSDKIRHLRDDMHDNHSACMQRFEEGKKTSDKAMEYSKVAATERKTKDMITADDTLLRLP